MILKLLYSSKRTEYRMILHTAKIYCGNLKINDFLYIIYINIILQNAIFIKLFILYFLKLNIIYNLIGSTTLLRDKFWI